MPNEKPFVSQSIAVKSVSLEVTEEKPKTGVIDSVMNVCAGLLIHQLFLFFALPALCFSLMAREANKQKKPTKAKSNGRIAGKFNLTCNILLLVYLVMRLVIVIIHLRGMENPMKNYMPPQNSILFNFLAYGLRG